jgi:hypothetical protein
MRPGVRLHSIVGDRGSGGPPELSSDGVVPYESSHLPQAESERVVPAGHTGTLKRPETSADFLLTTERQSGSISHSSSRWMRLGFE